MLDRCSKKCQPSSPSFTGQVKTHSRHSSSMRSVITFRTPCYWLGLSSTRSLEAILPYLGTPPKNIGPLTSLYSPSFSRRIWNKDSAWTWLSLPLPAIHKKVLYSGAVTFASWTGAMSKRAMPSFRSAIITSNTQEIQKQAWPSQVIQKEDSQLNNGRFSESTSNDHNLN